MIEHDTEHEVADLATARARLTGERQQIRKEAEEFARRVQTAANQARAAEQVGGVKGKQD